MRITKDLERLNKNDALEQQAFDEGRNSIDLQLIRVLNNSNKTTRTTRRRLKDS